MKLISWNVNGLRSTHKAGYWDIFFKENADIICLQEVKAVPTQLPEALQKIEGYHCYFNFPAIKKGYSGVAIFTKELPEKVEYGLGVEEFDQEGRVLVAHYKDFVLLNVYFPNGGGGPDRLKYKLDFYDLFLLYIEKLQKRGKSIIFCGDVNTAHEEIDLARPKANEENTGFLPEERAWIDEVINHGYIDTYRFFYPDKTGAYTYWDMKSSARDRNVGWRIDYFFVSANLQKHLKTATILSQVFGSDHCPLVLELK